MEKICEICKKELPEDEESTICQQCRETMGISKRYQDSANKPFYKKTKFIAACAAALLVAIIIVIIVGNNKKSHEGDVVYKIDKTSQKQTTEEYVFDYDVADNISNEIDEPDEPEETEEYIITEIKEGQRITVDNRYSFKIDYTDITKDVIPKKPQSFYRHYTADSGKTYIDVCLAYKNLESVSVRADDVGSVVMYYDNNYEYTGFSTIEENNRGSFTYTNITYIDPLSTEYLHYLIEVPDEVVKSGKVWMCFFA